MAQGAGEPGYGTARTGRRAQLPLLFPRWPVRYVTVSGARVARGQPLCARRRRHRGLVGRDRRARRSDADRGTAHQDPAAPGHQCARRRNPDYRRCTAGAVPARGTAGRLERLGRHRRARLSGAAAPDESPRRTDRAPADRRGGHAGRQHARRLPHRVRDAESPGRHRRDDVAGPALRACSRRPRSATC